MRLLIYTVGVPILAGVAFGQDAQPAAKAPAQTQAQTADTQSSKGEAKAQEAKTQTFSGTLVDAGCAGGSGANKECMASANTNEFGLKTKDGKVVKFDDVGNARVKEVMKTRKHWTESASANKPIKVKASGVMSGEKLVVVSVD